MRTRLTDDARALFLKLLERGVVQHSHYEGYAPKGECLACEIQELLDRPTTITKGFFNPLKPDA